MTKIKICGITNLEDAKMAVELGADYIGLNFSKTSPRHIELSQAQIICQQIQEIPIIGVFVEQTTVEINSICQQLHLDGVQIYQPHDLADRTLTVFYGIRMLDNTSCEQIKHIKADFYLLDTYNNQAYGGTGQTFAWDLIPPHLPKLFLAGGINPSNIANALAYNPCGICICSGVESAPGIKDRQKLQQLFEEINHAA